MAERHAKTAASSGVTITRRTLEMVSIAARRGAGSALAAKVAGLLGIALPDGPKRAGRGATSILGVGPCRWLAVRDGSDQGFEPKLAQGLSGLASVCLQSDAYVVFRVSGDRARTVLAKGLPIDLHPAVFTVHDAAVTVAGHVGVIIWRIENDTPTYDLAVFRSYEQGFAAWLHDAAAEFPPKTTTRSSYEVPDW